MAATVLQQSPTNLWADAVNQLPSHVKQQINFSRSDKLNILDELCIDAEISKQEFLKSRWTYTRKDGGKVVPWDVFEKIIRWVNTFKQIGDIAVQYDPVHAALPWAGIRFLLQIVVNDTNHLKLVVEHLAWIAELICRYRLLEVLYIQDTSKATEGLKRALVKVYASILRYLSDAKQHFKQGTARRMIKSAFVVESELDSGMGLIRTLETEMHPWISLCDRENSVHVHDKLMRLLTEINTPLRRMDDNLKGIKDCLDDEKRSQIIKWLSPEPYKQYHIQTRKDVLQGTGQWLLSDPIFKSWKDESASSMLWLHGIPGSGKSKLVSIVIDDALNSFKANNHPQPIYFYCARNLAEPTRSDPRAILASLARQLSSVEPGKPLLQPTVSLYNEAKAEDFGSGQPQMDKICQLLRQLIELYPQTIIILDALDECDAETRLELLRALEQLLQESSSLVKIFASSRNDQDIVLKLSRYPNLTIESRRNTKDIALFVKAEVGRLIKDRKLLSSSNSLIEMENMIVDKVIRGADGMFRWASLQLQYLCQFEFDESIKKSLGRSPPTLTRLYDDIHDTLTASPDNEVATVFKNVLILLLSARTRLNIEEFLAVISIDPRREASMTPISRDLVLKICNNFVVFDLHLDTFRFAHLSVREYLESRPEYKMSTAHRLIAEVSIWCISPATSNLPIRDLFHYVNQENGKQVINLLLEKRSSKFPIENEPMRRMAERNYGLGQEVIALLLDYLRPSLQSTLEAIAASPRCRDELMMLLLKGLGPGVPFTVDTTATIVRRFNTDVVKCLLMLLMRQEADVPITEEVLRAAAAKPRRVNELKSFY